MREAWKPLHARETDAALVRNQFVPELLEKGFNKLYDFVEGGKPHGRPDRVTVARKSFIERNPELLKRYWKATIRGYHFMRIVPENFPFQRMVESKIRVNDPDPSENMRDLRPMRIMESAFFPLDGQLTAEGVWRISQEHQSAGVLSKSITRSDVEDVVRQELVKEAWEEISQTDEVKRNLERLQPVVEKYGYSRRHLMSNEHIPAELDKAGETLRLYAKALSGREIHLVARGSTNLRGAGWVMPVSDAKALTISLPAKIDRFPTEKENFDWYKVVLTHQAGHFEFGSFDFKFDRASNCFDDWRPRLARKSAVEIGAGDRQQLLHLFPDPQARRFDIRYGRGRAHRRADA